MRVNRSGKSKKVIYHSQAKKEKRTKNDLQKIIKKTKKLTTGTPLILGTDTKKIQATKWLIRSRISKKVI